MSLTTTSRRMKRGLRNHPAPLDMSLLGVQGSSSPRRRTILVSAARPSIRESVAALGLNYSLSSGGIPEKPIVQIVPLLPRPLPQIPNPAFAKSSPNLVLDTSSDSSHYTATATYTALLAMSPLTTPPNLARLCVLSLPTSPVHLELADAAIRQLPPPPPSGPTSPVTPPLLTPALVRPARRWGMMVFPQDKVIRRMSSTPSSPVPFGDAPASPTSILAVKSPMEQRDSKRFSDALSLITPFTASLPQEAGIPPVPPIPATIPPLLSVNPLILPASNSSSLPQTSEDLAPDNSVEMSCSPPKIPGMTLGKRSNLGTIKESDSPVKAEEKQSRSSQVKANRKPLCSNSHHKRIPLAYRRESSVRRPNRRPMLKRDSGAPFADHVAMAMAVAMEVSSVSVQEEGTGMKEGRRSTRRWSASRRFLRASTKRAKATVVMMKKGKEEAEEKDIAAVIPQLRGLKTSRRLGL